MKTVLFILLVALVSCQDEQIQVIRPRPEYTFEVTAIDKARFTASIRWGRNELEYVDHVTAEGFASSVKLGPDDKFILTVSSPGLQVTITNNLTKDMRYFVLHPGQPLTVGQ